MTPDPSRRMELAEPADGDEEVGAFDSPHTTKPAADGRRRQADDPLSLVVVTHPLDRFYSRGYLLAHLVAEWEKEGIRVSVVSDPDRPVEADAAFLHVDLTVVPEGFRRLAGACPVVINGGTVDISKRRISRHLVRRSGSYRGPVIVKTDRNFGGRPERERASASLPRRALRALVGRLPWCLNARIAPGSYPVYPSKEAVPFPAWLNRRLVVEAFLPERDGEYYCLRNWVFLGDREVSIRSIGKRPVLKAGAVVDREYDVEIPDELRRLREELGFEFGKFDFALLNGRVVLYDVNRTPSFAAGGSSGAQGATTRARVGKLASGLHSLLGP